MKFFIVLAALAVACNARVINKRAAQNPLVWDALKVLRGGKDLTVQEQQDLIANAVAGKDYPANAVLPNKVVDCSSYKQAGFYADPSDPSDCQVFHRCDDNGVAHSFLCPNGTLFNQITLVCDWFFNVECSASAQFVDYSNSRLSDASAKLLDDQLALSGVAAEKSALAPVKVAKVAAKPPKAAGGLAARLGDIPTAPTTVAPTTAAAAAASTAAAPAAQGKDLEGGDAPSEAAGVDAPATPAPSA
jgi:hypothetical protein